MDMNNVDMNKTYYMRKEDRKPRWHVIDAEGEVLGRLATKITNILRGKHTPLYTPHTDTGDYVVVINAEKIVLTGDKWDQMVYVSYSGWIGGKKEKTPREAIKKDHAFVITHAVKGMFPKQSALARQMVKKLKIYNGTEHPHIAQVNTK